MPVSLEEAQSAAQDYLDKSVADASVSDEGVAFYGYYTFDYQVDGKMAGMLSVNGIPVMSGRIPGMEVSSRKKNSIEP